MYNYFANQKKKQLSIQLQNTKNLEQRQNQQKLQKNKKLIKRYIQRTTHGYDKMVNANKQICKYRQYQHQFRDFDKRKNIGPPSFYFKQRNDKQRVNNAVKQNQDLDDVPFCSRVNPTNHRFRDNRSQHDFKYTSYNTASRIVETVQNMKTNEVPTSWDLNIKQFLKTQRTSAHNKASTSERKAKNTILPSLNVKHFPKSIQSINNKIVLGPLKNALVESKKVINNCAKQDKNTLKIKKKNTNMSVKFKTFHVRQGDENIDVLS